jgi:hypothetical protein
MASNGAPIEQAILPVITAYETTTQANIDPAQKAQAFSYLETFQKSVRHDIKGVLGKDAVLIIVIE